MSQKKSSQDQASPTAPLRRDTATLRRLAELALETLTSPRNTKVSGEIDKDSLTEIQDSLPGYRIDGLLGRGGMGTVYDAVQLSLNREMALKVLPAPLAAEAGFESRFEREARLMAGMSHPNIVTVYDFGRTDAGQYFFTMEKIDGCDLNQLLKQGPIHLAEVSEIVLQVCDALDHTHQKGLLHRDIKPSNVFVTGEGLAKLGDFGLVQQLSSPPEESITEHNRVHGTPEYIAPERFEPHTEADPRSDIFSLGVLAYELLTGKPPVGNFRLPSELIATVPKELDKVILQAIEPDPIDRQLSVSEFCRDWESAINHISSIRQGRKTLLAHTLLIAAGAVAGLLFSAPLLGGNDRTGVGIDPSGWTMNTPVWETLLALGKPLPDTAITTVDPVALSSQVETGRLLVENGEATGPDGKPSKRLSYYFRCTDCHNTVREDYTLTSISSPAEKLRYAVEYQIPLVQGSTFAGMINRDSFYNGDYAKKYRFSPDVRAAGDDLRKAIDLCTRECSQGRDPAPWEREAMLAYFWSLQWELGDLDINDATLADWKQRALDSGKHSALLDEIESRYAPAAPATFGQEPEDSKVGFPVKTEPDLEIGKQVFLQSCLHCHNPATGAAEEYFRDVPEDRAKIARKFKSDSKKSAYHLIRTGTHPEEGKRPYMPNYTLEKLSDFQIESLRAYLESK